MTRGIGIYALFGSWLSSDYIYIFFKRTYFSPSIEGASDKLAGGGE